MRRVTYILLFFAVVLLLPMTGCTRRPLDMEYMDRAELTVILDWEAAELDPAGATIMFFPQDGSEPIVKLTHSDTTTVSLAVGFYSIIAFNETVSDFDYISFRNTDHFETIEAYVEQEGANKANEIIYYDPDILACASVNTFQVTFDMVEETRSRSKTKTKAISQTLSVELQPRRVVYPAEVIANVRGMNRLSSAGAYVTGFTEGVFLATGRTSIYSTTQKFSFTERIFDAGSSETGVLKGAFNCFGLREEPGSSSISGYTLSFRSILIDGNSFQQDFDINNNISTIDVSIGVKINIAVKTAEDPIVIPEAEGKGGWEVNVTEWEEVVVPIEF